jgi:hypothetical protein
LNILSFRMNSLSYLLDILSYLLSSYWFQSMNVIKRINRGR